MMTKEQKLNRIAEINALQILPKDKLKMIGEFFAEQKKLEEKEVKDQEKKEASDKKATQDKELAESKIEAEQAIKKIEIVNEPSDIAKTFFSMLKGEKGDTPTTEELIALIEPLIPDVKDGENGKDYILTAKDKKEIASKVKVPIVEKVIEKTEIIKEQPIVTNEIKEVAAADTAEEIKKKLESLKKDERLDIKAIKGVDGLRDSIVRHSVDQARGLLYAGLMQGQTTSSGGSGGGHIIEDEGTPLTQRTTLNFVGAGVAVTDLGGKTTVTISGASVSFADNEVPTGTVDDSNVTFTLANTPSAGTVKVYVNRLRMTPTADFTISGATITLTSPVGSGGAILADYQF